MSLPRAAAIEFIPIPLQVTGFRDSLFSLMEPRIHPLPWRAESLSLKDTLPHGDYLLLTKGLFLRGEVNATGFTQTWETMLELGQSDY